MGNVIMKAQQITYGASNVEKALDDLKAPELIELNKRMDAIDAWKANVHEVTFTGSELTIENALALPARSLITEIEPIQDLHGYDHPWVGGADRNLLPDTYTAQSASVFGLTVTKVDNGLRFVGVPNWNTQTSQFRAASSSDIATLYADGASSACFLKASNQYINIDSCRVDGNDIIVVANTTATTTSIDFTLEFMMYKGTAPTAFAPYSNICPISGRDSDEIERSGKNLVKGVLHNTSINGYGVVFSGGTADSYAVAYCKVKAGETYTVKTSEDIFVYGLYNDVPVVGALSLVGRVVLSTKTFTPTIDAYLAYRMSNDYTTPQIEVGTESTTYEAPQVVDVIIQLGTTVYGADINWDTGVATVTHAMVTFDGSDDESWNWSTANSLAWIEVNGAFITDDVTQHNVYTINNMFEDKSWVDKSDSGSVGLVYGNSRVYVKYSGITSVADAKALFASNNLQVCYELATPIELTLTPTQLQMLKGYNRVTVASGYATIELKALVLGGDN